MSRQPHYGISLLDIVVAIALAAILSALVFQSLQQTRRSVKKIQATIDIQSMLIHFNDRIFKDIQGAFIPQQKLSKQNQPQTETAPEQQTKEKLQYFVLERINVNEKSEADHGMLHFITTSSLIIYDAVTPRAVRVQYELKKQSEKKTWQLFRLESSELDYPKFTESIKNKTGLIVLTNIESLEITCYGPKPQEKTDLQSGNQQQQQKNKDVQQKQLTSFNVWNSDERLRDKKTILPNFIELKGTIHNDNSTIPVAFSYIIPIESVANENPKTSIMDQILQTAPGIQVIPLSGQQQKSTTQPTTRVNS